MESLILGILISISILILDKKDNKDEMNKMKLKDEKPFIANSAGWIYESDPDLQALHLIIKSDLPLMLLASVKDE